MWHELTNYFSDSPENAIGNLGLLFLLILFCICYLVHYRKQLSWWWLRFIYEFPLVGKIAMLARDRRVSTQLDGWRESERVLCQDFYAFSRSDLDPIEGKEDFERYNQYISKAGDSGRTPMPIWAWFLTFLMVIAEALVFSYILAPFLSPNASKSEQLMIAYGIAGMLSVLLVAFSHFSGHELYVSSRLRFIRRQWMDLNDARGNLEIGPVSLENNQNVDMNSPFYIQMLNRIQQDRPRYHIALATLLLVVVVAVSAAMIRWADFSRSELNHSEQVSSMSLDDSPATKKAFDGTSQSATNSKLGNPFDNATVDSQSKTTDTKSSQDNQVTKIKAAGNLITDILLSVIFVALQLLGVLFGWRWGFAGKESHAAYVRLLSGGHKTFSTFEEMQDNWKSIGLTAQAKLMTLQQKFNEYTFNKRRDSGASSPDINTSVELKTYNDYLKLMLDSDKRTDEIINRDVKLIADKSQEG